MKVLLINPPSENTLSIGFDSELLNLAGTFPPVGLLYIASVLKSSGIETKIIDCPAQKISHNVLINHIKEYTPDIIGITTFTTTMTDVLICAQNIKSINKRIITVLGGHHVYSYPELSASYPNIDYVLKGEADYSFKQLVQALQNNESIEVIKKIPGILFKLNNEMFINNEYVPVNDLDALPIPDRSLLPPVKYFSVFDTHQPEISIISSRGCPFNCSFCFTPEKTYRSRSNQNVVQEIISLYNQGFTNFFFFDDLFSIKPEKLIEISKLIIENNLKISWSFRARINSITHESIAIAKKAGLKRIQFGIETFDENVLKLCNKNIKTSDIYESLKICSNYKIQTVGNFMIGLPGQTIDIIKNDLMLAKQTKFDFAEFHIFTPLPRTHAYELALKKEIIPFDFWEKYAKNPIDEKDKFVMHYYTEVIDRTTQFNLCMHSFKSFYFRPKYVLVRLKTIKSFKQLAVHIITAIKLFFLRK